MAEPTDHRLLAQLPTTTLCNDVENEDETRKKHNTDTARCQINAVRERLRLRETADAAVDDHGPSVTWTVQLHGPVLLRPFHAKCRARWPFIGLHASTLIFPLKLTDNPKMLTRTRFPSSVRSVWGHGRSSVSAKPLVCYQLTEILRDRRGQTQNGLQAQCHPPPPITGTQRRVHSCSRTCARGRARVRVVLTVL